jgi:hypothetical protein
MIICKNEEDMDIYETFSSRTVAVFGGVMSVEYSYYSYRSQATNPGASPLVKDTAFLIFSLMIVQCLLLLMMFCGSKPDKVSAKVLANSELCRLLVSQSQSTRLIYRMRAHESLVSVCYAFRNATIDHRS